MLKLNLQLFGGRGSAGGNSKASAESKALTKILSSKDGTVISVERFNSVTGKSTGKYVDYTLQNGVWSSAGYGSFNNDTKGFTSLNSKKGVVPEVKVKKKKQ